VDDIAKATLRGRIRAARAGLSSVQREAAAEAVATQASALPELEGASVVLGYHALPEELDPAPLLQMMRARGARIALPRVADHGELTLHWVDEDGVLTPGAFGILEPSAAAPGPRLDHVDVVIVPGVAFDARCTRLGLGGGFYDRLLDGLPSAARAVALAYDVQMVEIVPACELDRAVHVVVTPTRVHRR
jgi:5-formyltetrahydrofolate cyclo-ligase